MKGNVVLVGVLAASVGLSGCSTLEGAELGGMGLGLLGGGLATAALLGDQSGTTSGIILTLTGAVIGAYGGRKIAKQVFEKDLEARGIAYQKAMSQYAAAGWKNPDTKSTGYITRVSTPWRKGEEVCANFSEAYNPAGQHYDPVATTTCLSATGWRVL